MELFSIRIQRTFQLVSTYIYCVCSKTYTHNMVVFFIVYYHSCTASSYCIVRLEMGI